MWSIRLCYLFVVGNRQSSRDLDFPAQCPVRQGIGKYIIGTCARFSRKLKILVVRIVSMIYVWMEGIKNILYCLGQSWLSKDVEAGVIHIVRCMKYE